MNILLVGEYIAPAQYVAAIRWTKIAKYLKREHDVSITVLTDQKNWEHHEDSILHNAPKVDEMLLCDMENFSRYYEVPCGRLTTLYLTLRKWVRGSAESRIGMNVSEASWSMTPLKWFKREIKWLVFDIRSNLHARDLWHFYQRNCTEHYDAVISSFSPAWSHKVGSRIKRTCPDTIWIADFRDPFVTSFGGAYTQWRHRRFMMRHCAAADHVLRVSDTFLTDTPPQIPVHLVPNGYDPEETLPPLPPPHFDLVFTGSLYGERSDIGVACEVLRQLCEEGKLRREETSVVYAGQDDEVAKILAKKHHAEGFLHTTGLLPRSEARKLQQMAAILLQAGWNTELDKCLWTGKMYEYMAAQKPIVYLVFGNVPYSEPGRYIDRLGGCCYEQCRHEETWKSMKEYILEKYQEWKATGNVTVQQDQEYIAQYSYAHIAEQIWMLIQNRKRMETAL